MSEEDQSTSEMKEGEIVLWMVFVADRQAAEIVEPGKETFDSSALAVAAQPATIVEGGFGTPLPVRDQALNFESVTPGALKNPQYREQKPKAAAATPAPAGKPVAQ